MSTHILKMIICVCIWISIGCVQGCRPKSDVEVIVYCAADREFAKPILAGFERRQGGAHVVAQYDIESTKTVGLANRILAEANRPRCDVFWNNEILHTLRLERSGLLKPVNWDVPSDWPSSMRSSSNCWIGIGARARVLIVNRDLLPASTDRPKSVMDLADPKWKGKCGFATPLFGTTATHFTVLYNQLGKEVAKPFLIALRENGVMMAGNKQVAQSVASGSIAFGLTDTDDALLEMDAGLPVDIIFPDQGETQMGTMLIPNTVSVLDGGPHPQSAIQLANYLCSEETESRLAMGASGQFPVRPNHPTKSRLQQSALKWLDADFYRAADSWEDVSQELQNIFGNR
ncbi:MAG: extracellular solute-binding protein [Planctomycetales bacterium]|nr:extracellular solute-binding protein [Planctomycetales bacterium]